MSAAPGRELRSFDLGQEPSMVDEYARYSIDERLELFRQFRLRMIGDSVKPSPDWKDFMGLLERHGVEYLIVGGGAVNAHGFVRLTEDLDFWLARNPVNAERVVRVVDEFGFAGTGLTVEKLLLPGKAYMLGRIPNRIDLLTTISGVDFDEAWARRVHGTIDGMRVPLISLPDLLANKRAAGRLRDLADIEEFEKSETYRR